MGNAVTLKIRNETDWDISAVIASGSSSFNENNAHKFDNTTIKSKHHHIVRFDHGWNMASTDIILTFLFSTDEIDEIHFYDKYSKHAQVKKSHRIRMNKNNDTVEIVVANTKAHNCIIKSIDFRQKQEYKAAEIALLEAFKCSTNEETVKLIEKASGELAAVKLERIYELNRLGSDSMQAKNYPLALSQFDEAFSMADGLDVGLLSQILVKKAEIYNQRGKMLAREGWRHEKATFSPNELAYKFAEAEACFQEAKMLVESNPEYDYNIKMIGIKLLFDRKRNEAIEIDKRIEVMLERAIETKSKEDYDDITLLYCDLDTIYKEIKQIMAEGLKNGNRNFEIFQEEVEKVSAIVKRNLEALDRIN